MTNHTEVGAFLEQMAEEAGMPRLEVQPVLRRARQRLARTSMLALIAIAAVVSGALAGVRALEATGGSKPVTVPKQTETISFVGYDGLYLIGQDGSGRRMLSGTPGCAQVTDGSCAITWIAWAPDGSRLALQVESGAKFGTAFSDVDLFLVDADGSDLRHLADCTGCAGAGFAWAPDGSQIAFARDGALNVIDVGDGSLRRLGPCPSPSPAYFNGINVGQVRCAGLAWSPDGSRIAFIEVGSRAPSLRVVSSSSGEELTAARLDVDQNARLALSWSPDGTRLAFYGEIGATVIGADGSGERVLGPGYAERPPSWSADGQSVLYADTPLVGPRNDVEIWVADANGGNRTRLYRSTCCTVDGYSGPEWSPDGHSIAFSVNGQLYSMAANGSHLRRIGYAGYLIAWDPAP